MKKAVSLKPKRRRTLWRPPVPVTIALEPVAYECLKRLAARIARDGWRSPLGEGPPTYGPPTYAAVIAEALKRLENAWSA